MQIPQTVMNTLSAKGKGYVEAAIKIAEGHRLIQEGTIEMAHLDGKRLTKKGSLNNGGGADITATVRNLPQSKATAEDMKKLLKDGPMSTSQIMAVVGRTAGTIRRLLTAAKVPQVGSGNLLKWSLTPEKARMSRKTVANKTMRRAKKAHPKKGRAQTGKSAKLNMKLRRPNEKAEAKYQAAVLKALATKPMSTAGMIEPTGFSFYPLARACAALEKEGKVTRVVIKDDRDRNQNGWKLA